MVDLSAVDWVCGFAKVRVRVLRGRGLGLEFSGLGLDSLGSSGGGCVCGWLGLQFGVPVFQYCCWLLCRFTNPKPVLLYMIGW